jgi:hypothetical protein
MHENSLSAKKRTGRTILQRDRFDGKSRLVNTPPEKFAAD